MSANDPFQTPKSLAGPKPSLCEVRATDMLPPNSCVNG